MQLKTAFLSFALLICPCALCYGQVSFLGVNGERGYSAMRGVYVADLDNGFAFTPSYEFYRQSDASDVEKTGSLYRYGLQAKYDFSDEWAGYGRVLWLPHAVGNRAVNYYVGGIWYPFYRYGILKNPYVDVRLGQGFYRVWRDKNALPLGSVYKQTETSTQIRFGAEVGPWNLEAAWHKVIQYKSPIHNDISFGWADIPFMTAVVQGFLREAAALQVRFPTRFLTPYAAVVRYEYAETGRPASAVRAGVKLTQNDVSFSGGVEVFEPRREENRKTFFSMQVEIDF